MKIAYPRPESVDEGRPGTPKAIPRMVIIAQLHYKAEHRDIKSPEPNGPIKIRDAVGTCVKKLKSEAKPPER